MTKSAKEYRKLIAALGLTQVGAAAFLGVSERASRNWALGQTKPPRAAVMLLRLMVAHGLTCEEVVLT